MKNILLAFIMWAMLSATQSLQAQSTDTLMCGDTVAGRFSSGDLSQAYTIDLDTGTTLIVHSDPLPLNSNIGLEVEILSSGGALVGTNPFSPDDQISVLETSSLISGEAYTIMVRADSVGEYQLFASCVRDNGEVVSNNNLAQDLACGDEVDNTMLRAGELHRYMLFLEEGTVLDVFLESLYGDFAEMTFELGLYSPSNQELDRISDDFKDTERTIFEQNITLDGVYRLYVKGYDSTDENYRLSIDCTMPNGDIMISGGANRRVLEPTLLSTSADDIPTTQTDEPDNTNEDTLPPFVAQDDLIEGIPNTGQLSGDEAAVAFTFMGDADETITIEYQHIRGDSHLDLWIQTPDKQFMFTSSLLIAESLDMQATLPQSGEYQIFLTLTDRPQDADAVFTIEVIREQ